MHAKLRTRLFLSLLPFMVIALGMGGYAIVLFSHLAGRVDTAVTENYHSIMAAQAMGNALAGMERELQYSILSRNLDNKVFGEYQQRFEENLALQLKGTSMAGEEELNQQLTDNYQTFIKTTGTLNSIKPPKDEAEEQTIVTLVAKMNVLLDRIRDLNYRSVLATSETTRKTTQKVTWLMAGGMFVVFAIAIITCVQLSRSILQPIQRLTTATKKLGEGNFDQYLPVTKDELGDLATAFNRLAAQLNEYRRNMTEEIVQLHQTMETTLATFPDPIFVLNKEGEIDLKNPAAENFANQLRLNGQLPERLRSIAGKSLQSGQNYLPHSFDEVVSYRLDDAEKSFLPRILAMRNKENSLFGVAVVLYDVTRFRLLDAAKTNLVATVSHELNTPLTSVRMALYMLLEKTIGSLNQKQEDLILTARNDTERLLRIFNDLMDLARLEEGHELHKEKIFPAELLQSVVEESADKISLRGLRLRCAFAPNLPAVAVDRQRIHHVFSNLISNAIKYSPAGGEICLRARRAEDEEDSVEFCVSDEGPGVPDEYHARIFDRFFRAPGQSKTGAGLGLSIAREITVAHGGRISVESAPGKGSTFCVVLKALET